MKKEKGRTKNEGGRKTGAGRQKTEERSKQNKA